MIHLLSIKNYGGEYKIYFSESGIMQLTLLSFVTIMIVTIMIIVYIGRLL
jgi:hypothetical protein